MLLPESCVGPINKEGHTIDSMPRKEVEMYAGRARGLRRANADAEYLLWFHLRNRKLLGLKFRRQQPIGSYIADFVCFEKRLIVELDGSQHAEPDQAAWDQRRTLWLESQDFRVLRFPNPLVYHNMDKVLARIAEALQRQVPKP